MLVAPVSAEQAGAALTALRGVLSSTLAGLDGDVLVDCGRLDSHSPAFEVATKADLLVMVARPVVAEVHHLAARLASVGSAAAVSVLLVGDRPYSVAEVAEAVGANALGTLPVDGRTAAALGAGNPASARALRRSRCCARPARGSGPGRMARPAAVRAVPAPPVPRRGRAPDGPAARPGAPAPPSPPPAPPARATRRSDAASGRAAAATVPRPTAAAGPAHRRARHPGSRRRRPRRRAAVARGGDAMPGPPLPAPLAAPPGAAPVAAPPAGVGPGDERGPDGFGRIRTNMRRDRPPAPPAKHFRRDDAEERRR